MKFSLQDALRKLSLKRRIWLMLGLILAIITSGGITMFLMIQSVTSGYQHTLDHFKKMESMFSSIRIQMLEMTRTEKDYFSSKDEIYIDLMEESFVSFEEVFETMQVVKQEVITQDTLTSIKSNIEAYKVSFKEAVDSSIQNNETREKIDSLSQAIEKASENSSGQQAYKLTELASMGSRFITSGKSSYLRKAKKAESEVSDFPKAKQFVDLLTRLQKDEAASQGKIEKLQLNLMKAEELILGSIEKLNEATNTRVSDMKKMTQAIEFGIGIGILAVMAIIIIILIQSSFLSQNIASISEKIRLSSHDTFLSSETLKSASSQVSKSASEQASAIQETVATLNEITAMVNRSVDNAQTSTDKASLSHRIANEGKESVVKMRRSMREIEESIDSMSKQVEESNQQIESIVKIIGEISDKTTVINDIVFQTKLLSFNASVEAARAGEHGKGFAVVAEEVGNLAQMSGNAAKEIAELLGRSRDRVQHIVQKSKEEMGRLVNEGSKRVTTGIDISNRCEEILVEVVDHVSNVKELMQEIAHASKEQAEGVNNISIAMNELDETTHSNSNMAHETSNCSNELAEQSTNLSNAVELLEVELHGTNYVADDSYKNSDPKVSTSPKEPEESHVSSVEQDLSESNFVDEDEESGSTILPLRPQQSQNASLISAPSADDPGFSDDEDDRRSS